MALKINNGQFLVGKKEQNCQLKEEIKIKWRTLAPRHSLPNDKAYRKFVMVDEPFNGKGN